MDTATHAMAGVILAGPLIPVAPVTASCFIMGSVLPDLDALSRQFGKIAFLRCHQTYTHSLFGVFGATAVFWLAAGWLGCDETWAPAALGLGMLFHVVLDASNTYGVGLLMPLSRKRFCTEWVFFIDGVVIAVSAACLAIVLMEWHRGQAASWAISAGYACFLLAYWAMRAELHRRAMGLAPANTRSLIPSAMVPWRFFGYSLDEEIARLFVLNVVSGHLENFGSRQTFDAKHADLLQGVAEYGLMRELSRGYCTTEAEEHEGERRLVCQDLRIRNFGGRFGRLDLTFDASGNLERKVFYV